MTQFLRVRSAALTCFLVAALALIVVGVTGCAQAKPKQAEKPQETKPAEKPAPAKTGRESWPTSLRIMTGPAGGTWYPLGAAIANIWKEAIPELKSVEVQTGGGILNIEAIGAGKADVGFGNASSNVDAEAGREPFEGKPVKNQAGIAAFYPQIWQLTVLKSSKIKEIEDMKGKSIGPAPVGNTGEMITRQVLAEHGLTYKDLSKVHFVSYNDAVQLMKDGNCDAFSPITTAGAPTIVDLANSREIDVISIRPEKLEALLKKYPGYVKWTIPAGTYKGVDHDVHTIGTYTILFCRSDLPQEMVYLMTKSMWENRQKLVDVHAIMKQFTAEGAPKTGIKLHPGAEKFYKEIRAIK